MSVNKKILEYLKTERISQSELATKTGIIQQNLNRMLNSKDMKVSQLLDITKALGLPLTYFIDSKAQVSNDEIEKKDKRIAELEKILDEKRRLDDKMLKFEEKVLREGIIDVLEIEFKNIKVNTKNELLIQLSEKLDNFYPIQNSPANYAKDELLKDFIINELKKMINKIEKNKRN